MTVNNSKDVLWSEKKREEMDEKSPTLLFDFVWIFKEYANPAHFKFIQRDVQLGPLKCFSLLLHSFVLLFVDVVYEMYTDTLDTFMGNMGCKHDRERRATSGCCLNLWFSVMWSWQFQLHTYIYCVRICECAVNSLVFSSTTGHNTKMVKRCTGNRIWANSRNNICQMLKWVIKRKSVAKFKTNQNWPPHPVDPLTWKHIIIINGTSKVISNHIFSSVYIFIFIFSSSGSPLSL